MNKISKMGQNTKSFINKQTKPNLLFYVLLAVFSAIFIILFAFLVNYLISKCYEKKTFWQYLRDGRITEPCVNRIAPNRQDTLGRILRRDREVFNISNQIYTYEQAKCKCETYGAQLATKDRIIDAYNNGAEWCNFGWSKGGKAFYPAQRGAQQRNPRCFGEGVVGGRFNRNTQFGVNCYGIRPVGKVVKQQVPPRPPQPAPKPEVPFCEKPRNFNASNRLFEDNVKPFNPNQWSSFD